MKFVLVVALIAVAIYFTVRAIERRRGGPQAGGGSRPQRRPRGPDDDPDFLRGLGNGKH